MNVLNNLTAVIIVAGGSGARARHSEAPAIPKQYQYLSGKSVLRWTLEVFLDHPRIDLVLPVIASDAYDLYNASLGGLTHQKLKAAVTGGSSRQASVRNGLDALSDLSIKNVLIHDAARPFVDTDTIDRLLVSLQSNDGVIVATPVADTLKRISRKTEQINETISREYMWHAQTPQGFNYQQIQALHHRYKNDNLTDDASLFEKAGLPVAVSPGNKRNIKITHPEDFALAESFMNHQHFEFRTGQGFDVHRFEEGDRVILCGIEIPYSQKLKGHSDADVAMHALTDAILGAIGAGDIGTHFPPSEARWEGAPSDIFLKEACRLVTDKGGLITHCDVTIICEAPKVGPHRPAMRLRLSEIMRCSEDRISIKATTTEKLGFTGRGEGISALATATVKLPEGSAHE